MTSHLLIPVVVPGTFLAAILNAFFDMKADLGVLPWELLISLSRWRRRL